LRSKREVSRLQILVEIAEHQPQFRETKNLAADYLSRTLTEAGGANAVNVIIVDFRAMDTNGEITVLVLVGLLAYGLLRARRRCWTALRPQQQAISRSSGCEMC
jgi:hypothetical protein